jgi:hypothetical protein
VKKLTLILFLAYICCLPISIVGMELFFGVHALLSLGLIFSRYINLNHIYDKGLGELFWLGIMFGLLHWGIIVLGLLKYQETISFGEILFFSRDAKFFFVFTWALFWTAYFEQEVKRICFKVMPIIVILISLYGILQVWTPLDVIAPFREMGEPLIIKRHFGNHHVLATIGTFNFHLTYGNIYILYFVVCALGTAVLFGKQNKKYKWGLGALSILGVSLVTTFSRNVWVNLCILSMGMGIRYAKRKVVPLLIVCFIVGGLFVSFHPLAKDFVFKAFDSKSDYQGFGQRIRNWNVQWKMFLDYPVLGIGHHQNERRYHEYREKYFAHQDSSSHVAGHAHNTFFQIGVANGVAGLLLWMTFLALLWNYFWKLRQASPWYGARSGLWLWVAFFVSGLTENALGDAEVSHNLFTLLGIVAVFARSKVLPSQLSNKSLENYL